MAIGPIWSTVVSIDTVPVQGTSPHVGLSPTIPHHDEGIRIDPPWSPPIAISTSPLQTCLIKINTNLRSITIFNRTYTVVVSTGQSKDRPGLKLGMHERMSVSQSKKKM